MKASADEERVSRMTSRAAEAIIESFGEDHGLAVQAWIRAAPRPTLRQRRWCIALVLSLPADLRSPGAAPGEVIWHVEGLSPNGAVVLFRRRLEAWSGAERGGGR